MKTPVVVEAAPGETPSLTGELVGETHWVLEHTQAHPLESAPEGPNLIVGRRGRDGQPGQRGLAARWRLADPARWGIMEWGRPGSS